MYITVAIVNLEPSIRGKRILLIVACSPARLVSQRAARLTRVVEGLGYANQRLASTSRKPSPTVARMLIIYGAACKEYLAEAKNGSTDSIKRLQSEIG